ncbi:MAG: alpha/beta fold hydrolase [Bryobacteraceae bacterium]
MLSTLNTERISFPPFELDLASGRLLRDSKPLSLGPKAFGVLRHMAERPGRLVSKEELLENIWPNVYVGDQVLKVQIAEIRKALADTCREPRFIETAHRRGYRFIAGTKELAVDENIPETHYARSGDVNIAYQVLGKGPHDLVFVTGWVSHLEYLWTDPSFARFLRRLAGFARVILFDKRGTGLSDPVPMDALPPLEQRMDDVRAVMDAAGCKRAVLCGVSEGASMSALFAATYPERTAGLVMIGACAKQNRSEGQMAMVLEYIRDKWGGPVGIEEQAWSLSSSTTFRQWWSAYLRTAASPSAAVAMTRMNFQIDVASVLPSIKVPTLVLHRSGDRSVGIQEGRSVASRIRGARFVELSGEDHLPFVGDQESILEEVGKFVNGAGGSRQTEPVFASVLAASFKSQRQPSDAPSGAWRRFQDHVTRELEWAGGRAFGESGNYLLASFDGPGRALRCASAIAFYAARFGIQLTAGIHTADCEISDDSIRGPAVEIARQIEERAGVGEILVAAPVRDSVAGSGIRFQRKGFLPADGPAFELLRLMGRDSAVHAAGA